MRLLRSCLILILIMTSTSSLSAAPNAQRPPLRLHRATLDLSTANRAVSQSLTTPSNTHHIIQFAGPITLDERTTLQATGVVILEYIPDFAYLVSGSPAQLNQAMTLSRVVAQSPFTLADKLSPALLRMVMRGETNVGRVQAIGWPNATQSFARELNASNINLAAPLQTNDLLTLAGLPSVRWIESESRPRLLNDVARNIMRVDPVWQQRSLFGQGQIVAVLDSGLDVGITPALSPDFAGRIVATHVISAGGDIADQNGHGTHVAGSVAGAGVQSGAITATHQYTGTFAGVAPEAHLVIQGFEADSTGQILGLPTDYYGLFDQAYANGARIHTNSWGDPTGPISPTAIHYGGYPYGSQRTDEFVWDHPDMSIFFAVGNDGTDGTLGGLFQCLTGNGIVDADSLFYPSTAKNVVSVGASESTRNNGGFGSFTWGTLSLLGIGCFLTPPLLTDPISDNANGMAGFSARGPVDDGRIKPDLVAPGTNIVSNRSHDPAVSATLFPPHETNQHYAYSSGTSMATPLAAGVGTLVRQWLTTRGAPNPSAALVKATLLNTTVDMAPGQYGTGATQEIPFARPNNVAGWGRADLGFVTTPLPYSLWFDDHNSGLTTNQLITYTHSATHLLQVLTNTQPLRIMLVWTDPPASLSAAAQLVNDLDLVVSGPGGALYYGNNVAAGDRINNVEGIVIANPPIGAYTVTVRAFNVPISTQAYALVVAGPLGDTPPQLFISKTTSSTTVAPGGLITYTLSANSTQPITSLTVSDTLPNDTTFIGASFGATLQGNTVRWVLRSPSSFTNQTFTLTVRVNNSATHGTQIVNNSYSADGTNLSAIGTPVTVTVQSAPPTATLSVTKTAYPPQLSAPLGLITYTFQVNVANGSAPNVILSDTLPTQTYFVRASDTFTLTGGTTTQISWNLGSLSAGQTVTRTLTVGVASDLGNNLITNNDYRVSASNGVSVSGTPVVVPMQSHRLWLPLIVR